MLIQPMMADPRSRPGAVSRGLDELRRWTRGRLTSPPPIGAAMSSVPADAHARMVELIALQRADGSWDLTSDLARAVGHDLAELEAAAASASGKKAEARRALATALALAWLDEHASAERSEWRMLAAKAIKWLAAVAAQPAGGESWAEAGAKLLTAKSG